LDYSLNYLKAYYIIPIYLLLRYEKEKSHINAKHKADVENMEVLIQDKLQCISALEKRLEAEIQEKRQLVKSVIGVVQNVNIDSQSNSVRKLY